MKLRESNNWIQFSQNVSDSYDSHFPLTNFVYFLDEAPDMRTMVLGEISDDEKFDLLRHILGLDIDADYIKSIRPDFLFILLTLNYLLQTNTLTKSEALGILETLIQEKLEPILDDIEYPETTDERAFRVSIVFVKMFKFLQTCASVIGFRNFEVRF